MSCEDVIEMNLNSSGPQLVIEGIIEPDSVCEIYLSYTGDYFANDTIIAINNALVSIEDNAGNSEVLSLAGNGIYRGQQLFGKENVDYTLTVTIDGKNYTGRANLLTKPHIYNVLPKFSDGFGLKHKDAYILDLEFEASPDPESYYLIKYYDEDGSQEFVSIEGKYLTSNDTVKYTSPFRRFTKGEKVGIEINAVDFNTYNYYRQLNEVTRSSLRSSSAPYNPVSNMGTNVLGCFTALAGNRIDVMIE
jgi:hypothetical protein